MVSFLGALKLPLQFTADSTQEVEFLVPIFGGKRKFSASFFVQLVLCLAIYVNSFLSISCLSNSQHWSQKTRIIQSY